jgi:hypothetical protein
MKWYMGFAMWATDSGREEFSCAIRRRLLNGLFLVCHQYLSRMGKPLLLEIYFPSFFHMPTFLLAFILCGE